MQFCAPESAREHIAEVKWGSCRMIGLVNSNVILNKLLVDRNCQWE